MARRCHPRRRPPLPVCRHAWSRVRDALVRQRTLRADVLDACRRRGLLYADDRRNAVFVCRSAEGRPRGAEIFGTQERPDGRRFRGLATGSRKARGGFWLPRDRNRPALVILTESAVNALCARSLRIPGTREEGAVVASTAGIANAVSPWIEGWRPSRIICFYDAESAGDHTAVRLQISDPRATRQRPHGAKDWNEILLRSRRTAGMRRSPVSPECTTTTTKQSETAPSISERALSMSRAADGAPRSSGFGTGVVLVRRWYAVNKWSVSLCRCLGVRQVLDEMLQVWFDMRS